ncbi:MAG: hypothetical protein HY928_06070 [Elusimicrobia bacterium]|nr:hypothetical protein [Elusimicrobiota bacterium]
MAGPKIVQGAPPPVSAAAPGTRESAVAGQVESLGRTLDSPDLAGYMSAADKAQIVGAWKEALTKHTSPDGTIDYPQAVNAFQNTLLNGREAGTVTRTAEHWGEISAGTYNLGSWAGPPAALGASLAWNTFSITKSQLVRSYRALRGQGPTPPAGNYWGETMNKSLVTESAAAGWASTLPNPNKVNVLAGTSKTLKLGELAGAVEQDGAGGILKGFWERYFGK